MRVKVHVRSILNCIDSAVGFEINVFLTFLTSFQIIFVKSYAFAVFIFSYIFMHILVQYTAMLRQLLYRLRLARLGHTETYERNTKAVRHYRHSDYTSDSSHIGPDFHTM